MPNHFSKYHPYKFYYMVYILIYGFYFYTSAAYAASAAHADTNINININTRYNYIPSYYVISLSPHLTDILQELNLQKHIKGVSDDATAFKNQKIYQQIPIVADAKSLFQEQILQIQSDIQKRNISNNNADAPKSILIALFWQGGNPQHFNAFLEKNKIPIIYFKTQSVNDILYTAYYLTYLLHPVGEREIYLNKIRYLQKKLVKLKVAQKVKPKKNAYFFQPIWTKPWMILNGENYSNDFLAHCGLENVFKNAPSMQISIEALLQTPFQHIIYDKSSSSAEDLFALKRFPSFSTQSEKRWHPVDTNVLVRPNLKHLEKLPDFCRDLAQ